jgi:multimeric flavodoxin WrbA
MKVLGISCSPRKGKTTLYALEQCMTAAREARTGIETEIIKLSGLDIHGCCACGQCKESLACSIKDDFTKLVSQLGASDVKAMVISTPVYLGTMASQCKAFLDRTVMFRRNGFIFRNRVGGVLAVGRVRNGGQELTIQAVHAAMLCHDMIVVSDGMKTSHFGGALYSGVEGGIERDEDGLATARNLGTRIASVISTQ